MILRTLTLTLLLAGGAAPPALGAGWNGNLNFLLGGKTLDKDKWEPVQKQGEFGILFDFKRDEWPLSIALDLLGSGTEKEFIDPTFGRIKAEASTSEFDIGVRKIWTPNRSLRPFIGGGISLAGAELILTQASTGGELKDKDGGTGLWFCGGVYWTVGAFNLGVTARVSSADVTIFGTDANAGGGHFGMLLGWHWGGRRRAAEEERPPAAAQDPDLERRRLELEEKRLQLEREKFEYEKQKQQPPK